MSDWTETIQERFQTAYAGMREKQAEGVRRNAQYYTPLLNNFEVGQWVWVFDPKIIPGSCDKFRLYWAGRYKIVWKIAPALVEVIAIYENGKTRIVSIDVLKEFRGENNNHGYPSDPSHPEIRGGDELLEIPSIPTNLQLQRNLISIPARGEYPPSPTTDTRSDLRGSSETRSIELDKGIKIDQDNNIPAVQEGIRGEQREGESRHLEEGDVEMEIIDLPIKENLLELPDRCETDRMETEVIGEPPPREHCRNGRGQ